MSKRKRSTSSNISALARYASSVGASSVGGYYGGPAGAYAGGALADYAFTEDMDKDFKAYTNSLTSKKMGKASYVGKMNKPKSVNNSYMTLATQIGGVSTSEQFGKVSDPHAVYLTHSTFDLNNYSFAIRFHLIRKLFFQAGIPVNDRHEELPLFNAGNSDGFLLVYTDMNTIIGSLNTSQYTVVDNQTLTSITDSFTQFTTAIESYLLNTSAREPHKLYLYQSDRNGFDTNWRLATQLNLMNESFTLTSSSSLQLQNRTAGDLAGAGDLNIDRADVQPLVGTVFQFRNGDPRLRQTHAAIGGVTTLNTALNGIASSGVRLARAGTVAVPAEFGPTTTFQNTPQPQVWANVMSSSKSILQPGGMKSCSILYKITGLGINFFKKLQLHNIATTLDPDICTQLAGRSQIIVFEEKMRTIGTNNLTIHYQRKNTVCVTSKTKKGGSLIPPLVVSEYNL